jgi:hypothetical protein
MGGWVAWIVTCVVGDVGMSVPSDQPTKPNQTKPNQTPTPPPNPPKKHETLSTGAMPGGPDGAHHREGQADGQDGRALEHWGACVWAPPPPLSVCPAYACLAWSNRDVNAGCGLLPKESAHASTHTQSYTHNQSPTITTPNPPPLNTHTHASSHQQRRTGCPCTWTSSTPRPGRRRTASRRAR